jgi:hypothetical protein
MAAPQHETHFMAQGISCSDFYDRKLKKAVINKNLHAGSSAHS